MIAIRPDDHEMSEARLEVPPDGASHVAIAAPPLKVEYTPGRPFAWAIARTATRSAAPSAR